MTSKLLHIREVSDMHLEFHYDLYDQPLQSAKAELSRLIPPLPTDKKTVLIVAGDLATARRAGRAATFLSIVAPRFKHVIYVLGNHEHYGMKHSQTLSTIKDAIASDERCKNVTVAGDDLVTVEIDHVTFLCGTMWTDYNKGDPVTAMTVKRYIRDHTAIVDDAGHPMGPNEFAYLHGKFREQLIAKLSEKTDHSKTVVVTHHMPSYEAVHPMYRDPKDPIAITLNAAFAANMDDVILEHKPAMWFFGHTHTKYDNMLGETRLICNPYGYPQEKNEINGNFHGQTVFGL